MMTAGIQKILFSIFLISFTLLSGAQEDAYYSSGFLRNDNAVYQENIRTVLLYKAGFELSAPIIQLNSGERLVLSFDDLDADYKQYRYTLVHCDAFWNNSDLQQMEYLNGFFEDYIEDYAQSYNTTVPYMNYQLIFPTEDLRITKPGNYILRVFTGSNEDENVVLTRRFMVYEPRVTVEGKVVISMDLDLRYTHQQLSFRILAADYSLADSYRNLHVLVMQNGRWDNMIKNIQPRNIIGSVYDFSLVNELVFPAGNEFRYFDMKTLKYNTDRMQSLQYTEEGYQVFLMSDKQRSLGNYYSEEDINGRKLIAANDTRDPYIEGDYAWVHFLLPYRPPLAEGTLHVFGAISDWQYHRSNQMDYNFSLGAYEAKILLKQGYYNYAYAFLENNTEAGDLSLIEGSYWETRNEYTVFVYYRQPGDSYDRLVGLGFINSEGQ
jgi:hypothetical protein